MITLKMDSKQTSNNDNNYIFDQQQLMNYYQTRPENNAVVGIIQRINNEDIFKFKNTKDKD